MDQAAVRPRLGTPGDSAEVVRLRQLMLVELGSVAHDQRWTRQATQDYLEGLADGSLLVVVVDDANRTGLASCSVVTFRNRRFDGSRPRDGQGQFDEHGQVVAHLTSLSTDPAHRRTGLARLVLVELLRLLDLRQDVDDVTLVASQAATRLYADLGFVPESDQRMRRDRGAPAAMDHDDDPTVELPAVAPPGVVESLVRLRPGGAMTDTLTTSDPTRTLQSWLDELDNRITAGKYDDAAEMFGKDTYWRDMVSFTWNIVTMEGKGEISAMLAARAAQVRPTNWQVEDQASQADGIVEGFVTFETAVGRGRGYVRLHDGGDADQNSDVSATCWTLLTTLQELKGHEEATGHDRAKGVAHGVQRDRESWLEGLERERRELGYARDPYVVVIGGGQGGIALGARLRRLGIPTIVLERNARAGDSWRNRYKSLHLHDPVWYDHMPYLPFPDDWPVFAAKDKIGDWLESYTKIMELNYWTDSVVTSAAFDEASQKWSIAVERDGQAVTITASQLVFATGMSAVANRPSFPGMEDFDGEQQHSSEHPGPESYGGKKCVVVGSNNSAHDICAALWEHGADVTMVQRSSTHIAKSDSLMDLALGGLYSERAVESGVTTDKADLLFASIPYRILPDLQVPIYQEMAKRDAAFYDRLEKAGFMLDFGEDGSGLFMKYLRRGSGYYIDVGASELVADGEIKLASGQVDHLTDTAVVLEDGTEIPADLVVYATGYSSMNGWVAQIVSHDMADRVGKVWGMGSDTTKDPGPWEGELRNMWKPTQQDGLWFHGGNLHQSRHYSQFLALQLKARMEGLDTPVYRLQTVHHTA